MAPERLSRLQYHILVWLAAQAQRTRGIMAADHQALVRALVTLGFDKGNISTSLKGLVIVTRTLCGKAPAGRRPDGKL